jgi:hypothetical protein
MARPCDRCKEGEYEEEISQCAEYSFAGGMLAWLCLDCRISWLNLYMSCQTRLEYERLMLELEWLNIRIENNENIPFEVGLELLEKRFKIEAELRALGKQWLKS